MMKFRGLGFSFLFYIVLLLLAAGAFYFIDQYGIMQFADLEAQKQAVSAETGHAGNQLLHVLLAMVVVIAAARLVGSIFHFLHQPQVIGEVLGGILLGPSVLGFYLPDVATFVLPTSTMPFLSVFAQIGIILYMFWVGLS